MTSHPPRGATTALTLLTMLAVVACSYETGAESPADTTDGDGGPAAPAGPVDDDVALPDPGILGGSCGSVTYTPPTATEAYSGQLCRPAGAEALDVGVVLVHGGGGIAGDHSAMTAWTDQYVGAGYTTLAIDYRLFDPGGESPVFPVPEQNVKAAVQFLRGTAGPLDLDPDRIVVHGASAGARLGAVAFTTSGDEIYAGPELWEGISDRVDAFVGFYSTYDGTMQYDTQYYGGDRDSTDPQVRANWVAADSIVNAGRPDSVHGPVALFTGELDWTELVVQQEQLADAVRDAGYDATTYVHPGGEHGYDAAPSGLTEGGAAAAFSLITWLAEAFPQN
jgi:acetyl esterase/lipase